MSYSPEVKTAIEDYVSSHVANDSWHHEFFDFVTDKDLAERLPQEFMAARYIYKLLRGLDPEGWLSMAQVRVQVLQYASIYEAAIHHLLYEQFKDQPAVQELGNYRSLKRISIPAASLTRLRGALSHNGIEIIPAYESVSNAGENKVRFDAKAHCARELGLIDLSLTTDLIEVYEARNAIHIHAEIRKGTNYEVELSRLAYMRMQPFREQVIKGLRQYGIYSENTSD